MKRMTKIVVLAAGWLSLSCGDGIAAPAVSYYAATNISRRAVKDLVAEWAGRTNPAPVTVEADPSVALTGRVLTVRGTAVEIPRQGVMSLRQATNYTDSATNALGARVTARVTATSNALASAVATLDAAKRDKGDMTVDVTWSEWVKTPPTALESIRWFSTIEEARESGWLRYDRDWYGPAWYAYSHNYLLCLSSDANATRLEIDIFAEYVVFTRQAITNRLTTTSDLTAATNGLYSASSGNALAAQVATIGAHLNAEDAQFIVTNYNSVAHMPEASFKIKLPDQSWSVIWNEMTRFNWLTNVFLPTNYATKAEVEEKADRAWGYFDSHSGLYAPDGYTWISSPRIAIAADLAYQRIVTSAGNVWVLCSHGMVTETGGDTNGYFRISDNKGNTAFEIVAGEERLIGAPATNVTVAADTLTIEYPVNAKPIIEVCASLTNHLWKAETDGDCIATVTWSGQAGAWIATVAAKQSPQPQMFVQASYKTGGETIVRNSAPVSLTHVYIGGTKYAVGTASVGGHTVMTLTPAN